MIERYRADIDGLRAIAVMSVIVYHAHPAWLPGGFVGVDIFFVISGFLITRIIHNQVEQGTFSILTFYKRRILRILPVTYCVIALSLLVGAFSLSSPFYSVSAMSALYSALGIANFFFFNNTGYFDAAAHAHPLLHLWSLGVEEQFYLIWPFLCVASLSISFLTKQRRILLVAGIVLLGWLYAVYVTKTNPKAAFYLPLPRAWELGLGCLLAYAPPIRSSKISKSAAFLGLGLVVSSLYFLSDATPFPGINAIYPCFGAMLLIWPKQETLVSRFFSLGGVVAVGKLSFSLYLWHWPVLVFWKHFAGGVHLVGAMLLTLGLSATSYLLIENPVRRSRHPFAPVAVLATLPILIALSLVLPALKLNLEYGGSRQEQRLANFKYDNYDDWRITRCFLNPEQTSFSEQCKGDTHLKPEGKVVLWGDSLAAHLYPGLVKFAAARNADVMQYTGSLCPPFLDLEGISDRPYCPQTNRQAAREIALSPPSIAFLSAAWFHHQSQLKGGATLVSALRPTVTMLKKAGVKHIYLIGPFPGWEQSLPLVAAHLFRTKGHVPAYSKEYLNFNILKQDQPMRHVAEELGITYLSAIDALCGDEGCLVRTSEDMESLTSFDIGHLTPLGAAFFFQKIQDQVMWSDVRG